MTQYSKEGRKAIADAFRQAKKYLNKGDFGFKTKYICYALDDAYVNGKIDRNTHKKARNIIRERLYPYDELITWLMLSAGIPTEQLTNSNMQKYRHAWLNLLIKEFSQ